MQDTPDAKISTESRYSTGSTVVSMRRMSAHKLEEVIKKLEAVGADEGQIGDTCALAGAAFYREGDYPQAKRYLNQALTRYQTAEGKGTEIIKVNNQLGLVYTAQRDYSFAQSSFQEALDLVGKGNTPERANILGNMGQMCREQGANYVKAIEYLTSAMTIYLSLSRNADVADMRRQLGMTYFAQGEATYTLAVTELEQALALYGDTLSEEVAETAYHLALVYQNQANYVQALIALQKAMTAYAALTERREEMARVSYQMGAIYFAQKDYEAAKQAFDAVRTHLGMGVENIEAADALFFKGRAAAALEQAALAIEAFNGALNIYLILNDEHVYDLKLIHTYEQLGLVYQSIESHAFAISSNMEALALYGDGNRVEVAILNRRLGELYLASNNRAQAQATLRKACDMFRVLGSDADASSTQSLLDSIVSSRVSALPNGGNGDGHPKIEQMYRDATVHEGDQNSAANAESTVSWCLRCCGFFGTASSQQRKKSKEIQKVDVDSPLVESLNGEGGNNYGATGTI